MNDARQAQVLEASILLNIAMTKVSGVNALAALAMCMGKLVAGLTIGMNDAERKKAIDAAVAVDGPLCQSVRMAAENEIPNVKKFEAAKAATGGGAATRPSSPPSDTEPRWGNLG